MIKKHITAIDGLKGIAVLTVVFTHIPLVVWYQFIPQFLRMPLNPIISGGSVGVVIFFITTGFLMGYIYPSPTSAMAFYGRRYARLFPALLVMIISFTLLKLIKMPAFVGILLVVGSAFIMRRLWQIFHGKNLILYVLLFQGAVAVWYVFYLARVPSSVYYINWNLPVRGIISMIVNATLTLPFGNYVEQFDGIYWAVCAELFFYLLYPIIIAPLVQKVSFQTSWIKKILIFLLLIPFSYGLYFIGLRFLSFSMIKIHLIIYFVVGVFIGMNIDFFIKKTAHFQQIMAHPAWIIFMLCFLFSPINISKFFSEYYQRWLMLWMVIPTALFVVSIVSLPEKINTLLKNSRLIFFGKYSYAIFLTHSLVTHIVMEYFFRETFISGMVTVILVVFGTTLLSVLLYSLTEKPYFHANKSMVRQDLGVNIYTERVVKMRTIVLSTIILILLLVSFRAPLALFTFVYRHGRSSILSVINDKTITLSDKPFRQSFIAKENNLGMIITSLKRDHISGKEGGFVPFELFIRLFNDRNQLISQGKFLAYQIIESRNHPFGFPVITNAKGKKVTVEYQLSEKGYSEEIKIVNNEMNFLTVYFFDKKQLVKDPKLLFLWIVNKLSEPLVNPMFWFTLIHIAPFLLFFLFCCFFPRRLQAIRPKN